MQASPSMIETVSFAIAGDADNARDAVVEVTSPELFNGAQPVSNGCYDARMGTTDHHFRCITCDEDRRECQGHAGVIAMRDALVSPLFIDEIRRWLRVVCLSCGALVVDPRKFAAYPRDARLQRAGATPKDGAKCPRCGAAHPKIARAPDDYFTFLAEAAGEPPRPLRASEIRAAFERVAPADARAMGRDYSPADLVLTQIAVAPNTIRPNLRMGFGGRGAASSHDITNLTQYLAKRNLALPREPPALLDKEGARVLQNAQQILYDMIVGASATAATNGTKGKRGIVVGNRPVRALTRSLARKTGRLRMNLLGKRVFHISRSTISGNPTLAVDEVGFPEAFARTLQIAETVQAFNLERLMVYYANARARYPGCTRVEKRGGGVHRVDNLCADFRLEVGDVLHRDLVTGDFAFLNRQPSLERSSMGVHRLVVMKDIQTFQLNVAACDGYNADFDGDQMNICVPSTVMGRVEAGRMSAIARWFISTKSSSPVNGQVQDSVVGSFELTRSGARVDKYHAMQLFAGARPAVLPDFAGVGTLTGREVASLVFRQAPVNYTGTAKWFSEVFAPFVPYDPAETRVVMRRGVLEQGVLDKASVGAGAGGGLFHLIAREHGPQKALDLIFTLQQVAVKFVGARGFTVSTHDMVLPPANLAAVHEIVAGLLRKSAEISARLVAGELTPPIGMTVHAYYEQLQQQALKVPDDLLRPVITAVDPARNGLFRLIATGSKGTTPNLLNIMGFIGQVEINTNRIEEEFGFGRTSPYFTRFAVSPEAGGFVKNSYIQGMTASEFFFSSKNGRFDLINKALSTAVTGYQNRKSVKALESALVDNYRRLAKDGQLVQQLYGEDGLDARQVEWVRFRTVFLDDAAVAAEFGAPGAAAAAAVARLVADRDAYRAAFLRLEDSSFNFPLTDRRQMPVDVARLVRDVRLAAAGGAARPAGPLAPKVARVAAFCEGLAYAFTNEGQRAAGAALPEHFRAATTLLQMLVRAELAPAALATLAPGQLAAVLDAVRLHFARALADYGEAAGVLAAQAVSEPLTQYMLDSHHRSVGGGTDKSGLVRPSEIFSAKGPADEKSAEMLLRVAAEFEGDETRAMQIADQIELMTLARFVRRWDLLLEPFARPRYPPFAGDKVWMDEFRAYHPLLEPPADLTNWCARFVIDKASLVLKSMELETIVERLRARHPNVYFVHPPENAERVVVRAYLRPAALGGAAPTEARVAALVDGRGGRLGKKPTLLATTIRGVPGVTEARVVALRRHAAGPGGALAGATVYAIRTRGTNLAGVLANRRVDPRRLVSSSIGDTEKLFGIAAARDVVVREIRRVLGGAKAPNPRHLMVYADEMTRRGRLTSIEIGGVALLERDNPLLVMGYEGPAKALRGAAARGAAGRVAGITAPMLLGAVPKLGTLWNGFSMDEDFVRANHTSVNDMLDSLM